MPQVQACADPCVQLCKKMAGEPRPDYKGQKGNEKLLQFISARFPLELRDKKKKSGKSPAQASPCTEGGDGSVMMRGEGAR